MFSRKDARSLSKEFKINHKVVPFNQWLNGLNIEREHSDLGDDDTIAKIAIAHLKEFPDYYKYLVKLEAKLKKKWEGKDIDIFLK